MGKRRRFLLIALAILAIIMIGTAGYMIIEQWSFPDAIYMAVIILSTVGFQEVHSLSTAGSFFTIFLILGGTGTMLYAVTAVVQYLLEGNLENMLGRRHMKAEIAKLKGHTILCGYGKVGKEVARVFANEQTSFVVIESDEKVYNKATDDDFLCLNTNASNDETLKEAGIMNAK